jgi:hypothetical protein
MLKNKLKLLETESFELLLNYIQSELNNCKAKNQDLNAKTKTLNAQIQAAVSTIHLSISKTFVLAVMIDVIARIMRI